MKIRPETPADYEAISQIETITLGAGEAQLVSDLRANGKAVLSLVAEVEKQVVGHILFSPLAIQTARGDFAALGLAPMGVLPQFQRRGIGSALVQHSLQELKKAGWPAIVVLGHPAFYTKFGFLPAHQWGLKCPYDVPDDVFMALELKPNALEGKSGLVVYAPEFNEL